MTIDSDSDSAIVPFAAKADMYLAGRLGDDRRIANGGTTLVTRVELVGGEWGGGRAKSKNASEQHAK